MGKILTFLGGLALGVYGTMNYVERRIAEAMLKKYKEKEEAAEKKEEE